MVKNLKGYLWDLERFGFTPKKLMKRRNRDSLRPIICNSIPKAGTHLLERSLCLHPLLYRKLIPTIHQNNVEKYGGLNKILRHIKNGQILVTHLEYDQVIDEAIIGEEMVSFFMIRDPRDVVVSLSHYGLISKKHRLHKLFTKLSARERLLLCIKGNEDYHLPSIGNRLSAYSGWLNSSAMIVRFEDIIGGKGAGDTSVQRDVLRKIFEHCKVDVPNLDKLIHKVYSNKSPTFRKGVIGGWKDSFDSEVKDLFKEIAGGELIKYGYENDFNW